MTTAADHIPSRACYMRGCPSSECAQENYRYMSGLRLDHNRGRKRLRDAAPVLEHVQRLLANEWTVRQIAAQSNVSMSAVRYILYGQPTISNARALAILNVPIGPPPVDSSIVDATGTIRRLRALSCLGHTLDTVSAETGLGRHRLGRIRAGRYPEIDASIADTIERTYKRLSTRRGDCTLTLRQAKEREWHGPLAWDDIDDPACRPETEHRVSRARASRKPKVYADPARVARLTAAGKSAEQIAIELGCHKRTVIRARRRAEMAVAA